MAVSNINNIKALKNLRNEATVYPDLTTAVSQLKGVNVAEDGQIGLARYTSGEVIKTVIGVYHKGVDNKNGWTIYSYDDDTLTGKLNEVTGDFTKELGDVKGDIDKLDKAIKALDFEGTTGAVVTAITQTDGLVTATGANLTSSDKTVTVDGLDLAVNIDGTTIVKGSDGELSVASSAITFSGEDAIVVETGATGNKVSLNIATTDKVLSQSEAGLIANLELKYTKATDGANGKIELIGKNNTVISTFDTTDFTVDGFLDSVAWSTESGEENLLVFTWNTTAGKEVTKVNLSKYIDTYLAGDGLNLDSDSKTFSVKVKNGDKYLTVNGDGVASKGIDDAISDAVEGAKEELLGDAGELTDLGKVEDAINDLAELVGEDSVEDQVEAALGELNFGPVGGSGKFVQIVKQEDGLVSATAETITASDVYMSDDESATTVADAIEALEDLVGEDSVEDQISDAIAALTKSDTDKDAGKYVYSVEESNGVITVYKKALVAADSDNLLQNGTDGGLYLGNIFDCGTY